MTVRDSRLKCSHMGISGREAGRWRRQLEYFAQSSCRVGAFQIELVEIVTSVDLIKTGCVELLVGVQHIEKRARSQIDELFLVEAASFPHHCLTGCKRCLQTFHAGDLGDGDGP